MNKRGTHVGIVLSFALFVTFMFFIFFVLEPSIKFNKGGEAFLDTIEANLITKLSDELVVVTLEKDNPILDCLKLTPTNINTFLDRDLISENILAKNLDDNLVDSIYDENAFYFNSYEETLFEVFISNSIEQVDNYEIPNSCQSQFTTKSISKDVLISEAKVFEIKQDYESIDYDDLRNELGILSENDFGFDFEYNNGTVIRVGEPDNSNSVYVKQKSVIYFDVQGNKKPGFLRVKIW